MLEAPAEPPACLPDLLAYSAWVHLLLQRSLHRRWPPPALLLLTCCPPLQAELQPVPPPLTVRVAHLLCFCR